MMAWPLSKLLPKVIVILIIIVIIIVIVIEIIIIIIIVLVILIDHLKAGGLSWVLKNPD